jgi:hypothetical protein
LPLPLSFIFSCWITGLAALEASAEYDRVGLLIFMERLREGHDQATA